MHRILYCFLLSIFCIGAANAACIPVDVTGLINTTNATVKTLEGTDDMPSVEYCADNTTSGPCAALMDGKCVYQLTCNAGYIVAWNPNTNKYECRTCGSGYIEESSFKRYVFLASTDMYSGVEYTGTKTTGWQYNNSTWSEYTNTSPTCNLCGFNQQGNDTSTGCDCKKGYETRDGETENVTQPCFPRIYNVNLNVNLKSPFTGRISSKTETITYRYGEGYDLDGDGDYDETGQDIYTLTSIEITPLGWTTNRDYLDYKLSGNTPDGSWEDNDDTYFLKGTF